MAGQGGGGGAGLVGFGGRRDQTVDFCSLFSSLAGTPGM